MEFIESVCDDLDEWGACVLSQFSRLLLAAEKLKDPSTVINTLEAFHILKDTCDDAFMRNIISRIKTFLDTGNYPLKRFLVWFLTFCIYDLNESEIDLVKNLRFDEDVIVRYYAIIAYNGYKDYPREQGLSIIDKLVIDVSDVYACEHAL